MCKVAQRSIAFARLTCRHRPSRLRHFPLSSDLRSNRKVRAHFRSFKAITRWKLTLLRKFLGQIAGRWAVLSLLARGLFLAVCELPAAPVQTGAEVFFQGDLHQLAGKRIGLVSHQAAHHLGGKATWQTLLARAGPYRVAALLGPEHGFFGQSRAGSKIADETLPAQPGAPPVKVYSLFGAHRRPTPEMLADLDLLIVDLQDVGVRCYTYIATLLYTMEAAAAAHLPVLVLDRPNPIGGEVVDGPILELPFRSFVGCAQIPWCHGMTLGELARFFRHRHQIECSLTVVPMRGYRRAMTFDQTGLIWIPTSPQIPEATTPLYYALTNLLGELGLICHGVGYTLPFKVIGAPWMQEGALPAQLARCKLPHLQAHSLQFTPFFGRFQGARCQGALLHVAPGTQWRPFQQQLAIMLALKALDAAAFDGALARLKLRRELFDKYCGTQQVLDALSAPQAGGMDRLVARIERDRRTFMQLRKPYLLAEYA